MDIQDFVSVEEAAEILGYVKSSVTGLCRKRKLEGAIRIGHQWLIPRKTIESYEKAPQGFAAVWKQRREKESEQLAKLEAEVMGSSGEESKEDLEREMIACMKLLVRKIGRLEKIIAQEKSNT